MSILLSALDRFPNSLSMVNRLLRATTAPEGAVRDFRFRNSWKPCPFKTPTPRSAFPQIVEALLHPKPECSANCKDSLAKPLIRPALITYCLSIISDVACAQAFVGFEIDRDALSVAPVGYPISCHGFSDLDLVSHLLH